MHAGIAATFANEPVKPIASSATARVASDTHNRKLVLDIAEYDLTRAGHSTIIEIMPHGVQRRVTSAL